MAQRFIPLLISQMPLEDIVDRLIDPNAKVSIHPLDYRCYDAL